jgi:acetate kinase
MTARVLFLNAGSATIKASLVDGDRSLRRALVDRSPGTSTADALRGLLDDVAGDAPVDAVAHRLVHGADRFVRPILVDDALAAELEELVRLAPLHLPPALDVLRDARALLPNVPHVGCFDTAFHATLPEVEVRYPVPDRWRTELGIRRYGFHGLSVEWATTRTAELLGRPMSDLGIVVAHLGGGCSVTAVAGGRSTWTSMGYTPLEGLMMGTRSGSVDPGALLHLLRTGAFDVARLSDELEHRSGLLGVSGVSGDLREVEAAAERGDERARLAIDMFVSRAAAAIGAAATTLERLDALTFSGGIGEHAGRVRAAIARRLAVLGLPIVPESETGEDRVLGSDRDGPAVLRVEAREDLVAARAAVAVLAVPG